MSTLMKFVSFLILLIVGSTSAFGQNPVIKGTGILYWNNVPTVDATLPSGSEWGYVLGNKTLYYFDRDSSNWLPYRSPGRVFEINTISDTISVRDFREGSMFVTSGGVLGLRATNQWYLLQATANNGLDTAYISNDTLFLNTIEQDYELVLPTSSGSGVDSFYLNGDSLHLETAGSDFVVEVPNLYTQDGELDENRTVDLNTFDLILSNGSNSHTFDQSGYNMTIPSGQFVVDIGSGYGLEVNPFLISLMTNGGGLETTPLSDLSGGNMTLSYQAPIFVTSTSYNQLQGTSTRIRSNTTSTAGQLWLLEGSANGANYIGFRSAAALSVNTLYTFPSDGSNGQLLKTDGSGVLSWTNDSTVEDFFTDGDSLRVVVASDTLSTGIVNLYTQNGTLSGDRTVSTLDHTFLIQSGNDATVEVTEDAVSLYTSGFASEITVRGPDAVGGDGIDIISAGTTRMDGTDVLLIGATSTVLQSPYVELKTSSGAVPELRFKEAVINGLNYVGFKAAASVATNIVWTFPAADGAAGTFLQTNGSGVLSFASTGLADSMAIVRDSIDALRADIGTGGSGVDNFYRDGDTLRLASGVDTFSVSAVEPNSAVYATLTTLADTAAAIRADFPSVSGVSDGDYTDIDVTSSGTVWAIDTSAVTWGKLAQAVKDSIQAGSGGTISSSLFVFSNVEPSDTNLVWVDAGHEFLEAYPLRKYINGAWTQVSDECDYWDSIGKVISNGRPFVLGFSGQSNAAASLYFPTSDPTYYGDTISSPYLSYYNSSSNSWVAYIHGVLVDPFNSSVGANQIQIFAKIFSNHYKRSVRIVGTRAPGVALVAWESGGAQWTALTNRITSSGVPIIDAFVWVHGEAGLGAGSAFSTYQLSFSDFLSRLRSQVGNQKMLMIATSNALSMTTPTVVPSEHEGTVRALNTDNDEYTAWAQALDAKDTGTGDIYHFTTKEHESFGASIFAAYQRLPSFNKSFPPAFVINNTITNGEVVDRTISYPSVDALAIKHKSRTNNGTGTFSYDFGFGSSDATTRIVVKGTGSFGASNIEYWINGAGATATASDLVSRFSATGNYMSKPTTFLSHLSLSTGVNNSGDAVISFNHSGLTTAPTVYGKAFIAARATGSFSQSDLHFGFSPTGGANPIIGTNTNVIFRQTGLNGFGTISPTARLHVAGSVATQVTSITSSTTLDVSHHTVLVSGASSSVDITLPNNNSSSNIIGREIIIICNNLTNPVRILPLTAASDLILLPGGATTTALSFSRPYQSFRLKSIAANQWVLQENSDIQYRGTGTPESVVTANIGSIFQRTDGSTNTTLYIKQSGTGNTGWAPVLTSTPTGQGGIYGGNGNISNNTTATLVANGFFRFVGANGTEVISMKDGTTAGQGSVALYSTRLARIYGGDSTALWGGVVQIKNPTNSLAGNLDWFEARNNGTNRFRLRAPANLSSDLDFIWPSADGTNGQAIVTNGSGALGFATITGTTNLTFTGSSSPFTLNSDTGTDVAFAAGDDITLSRTSNELTVAVSPFTSDTIALTSPWSNLAGSKLTAYKQLDRVTIQGVVKGVVIPSAAPTSLSNSLPSAYRLTLGGFTAYAVVDGTLYPVAVQMVLGNIDVQSLSGSSIDLTGTDDYLIIQNTYYKP